MPFNIRSTASFASGEIVLLSHSVSVADDGFVQCSMNLACIEASLSSNLPKFRMESSPPVPLPTDVLALPLENKTLYLTDLQTSTQAGIAYLNASYAGVSLDQKRRIQQRDSQRSFSGTQNILARFLTGQQNSFFFKGIVAFDYTAESFSVTWSSIKPDAGPEMKPALKDLRNIVKFAPTPEALQTFTFAGGPGYKTKLVEELTIVPVGPIKRYQKSVTATAESEITG
jgi:hypothetical protein